MQSLHCRLPATVASHVILATVTVLVLLKHTLSTHANQVLMLMVLYCDHCDPVHTKNAEQRQTAADLWTKPTDLSHRPACGQL